MNTNTTGFVCFSTIHVFLCFWPKVTGGIRFMKILRLLLMAVTEVVAPKIYIGPRLVL